MLAVVPDNWRQVATDEVSGLGVVAGNLLARDVRIDSSQAQQRWDQVGVAGRNVDFARAIDQRARHDKRDVDGLLVGVVPLLVHPTVGAEHVTVVRAEHDDRVLVISA